MLIIYNILDIYYYLDSSEEALDFIDNEKITKLINVKLDFNNLI